MTIVAVGLCPTAILTGGALSRHNFMRDRAPQRLLQRDTLASPNSLGSPVASLRQQQTRHAHFPQLQRWQLNLCIC